MSAHGSDDSGGDIAEVMSHREGDDGVEFAVRFEGKTEPDDEYYGREDVEEAAPALLAQYERREGFVNGAPATLEEGDIERLLERRGADESSWEYKVKLSGETLDEADWFQREDVQEGLGDERAGMLEAFDESLTAPKAPARGGTVVGSQGWPNLSFRKSKLSVILVI